MEFFVVGGAAARGCPSRPLPCNLVIGHVALIIGDAKQEALLGAVGDAVLCGEFVPGERFALVDRIDDPFRVILARLDATVIDAKVGAKLKRRLDDIAAAAHVLEDKIPDVELWLDFLRFLEECIEVHLLAGRVLDAELAGFKQVEPFQQGELDAAVLEHGAEAALVVELAGCIAVFGDDTFAPESCLDPSFCHQAMTLFSAVNKPFVSNEPVSFLPPNVCGSRLTPAPGIAKAKAHPRKLYISPSVSLRTRVPMAGEQDKKFSQDLIGKTVVSKTGKRFGEVGDIVFEVRSGELIHMVLVNPTSYTMKLELEKDKEGNTLIPFSAVIASGDYMVVSEEDII